MYPYKLYNNDGFAHDYVTLLLEYEWESSGWNIVPHPMDPFGYGNRIVQFQPVNPSSPTYVFIRARTVCGWGPFTDPIMVDVDFSRGGGSIGIVYPNPVSDVLYIEIESSFSSVSKSATPYDVRLYDGLGNLLRQTATNGGTVQFNVSNLPEGVYFIHVYDGVSSTPEIHQVVVER